ncbi:ATP-binding cassette sub-family E member 1-like [Anneissia japonica]|uniref:ATP-binding cassette sub-family E member 1-like n=1 Tax=Anneissia japonica TaxID=1529436 RepID=UPI001425A629|nr:ATP-binding cassette sub-family E member 1-like [Anneissia japonica]
MPRVKPNNTEEESKLTRIAIVSNDKCKPKRCRQECKKSCPVVRMGKLCIEVVSTDKIALISEELCIGCGICSKKCPFEAINIINLPSNLGKDTTHRYNANSFKLHRFVALFFLTLTHFLVQNLSGGELQRLALTLCLGKPADVYLIDEPSAYLDSEQRLVAAKVIKRFILHAKKTGFVVEHDFIMATYLADRVIVFDGIPSLKTTANTPQSLLNGMNQFLESLEITFRRDPTNYRPRINKLNSVKDAEQKKGGNYFFLED